MAETIFSGGDAVDKTYFPPVPKSCTEPPVQHPGLVAHHLLTPTMQVRFLATVDATGSATVGDIIAPFPVHSDPVGALLALISAKVLRVVTPGVIDEHTIITRGTPPNENGSSTSVPPAPDLAKQANELPYGIERIVATDLSPVVYVGPGTSRTAFARAGAVCKRHGVYLLCSLGKVYVGYSGRLGYRMADGRQLPTAADQMIGIFDRHDNLSECEARVLEQMLWTWLASGDELIPDNGPPTSRSIDPRRYDQLHLFLSEAALALRHRGILFLDGSTRSLMSGPLAEPDRLGPPRRVNELPDGEVYELRACGVNALAARRRDGSVLLLRGSDVRLKPVASAPASSAFQRAAWLHSGILSEDGDKYTLTRDVVFGDAGAAAKFVTGAGHKTASDWLPIEPSAMEPMLSPP